METEYITNDGTMMFQARIVPYQAEGEFTGGIVFTLVDVTELRKLAREADLQTELSRQRLAEIEELYETSPQAMALVSTDMRYLRLNKRLAEINGTSVEESLGRRIEEIVPELREQVLEPIQQVLETGERIDNLRVIGRANKADESERVWETDWYPVRVGDAMQGVGINVRDITEHVHMSMELRRVMQELQHRVKNMLANVLALVSRAGRDATTDTDVFNALSQRIHALAQTHKLLTQSNWSSASLHKILEPELEAVYGEDRVDLKGPKIEINARAALSLGMAIHELATNAAKYGAFSVSEGHVRLSWVRQDDGDSDNFIFTWVETGGPETNEAEKDGFGSQLIRSTIEGSLSGQVEFSWEPKGLRCVMTIPASLLIEIPNDTVYDTFAS